MFPGSTSKMTETKVASAASIVAKSDILLVSGTTQVDTITPNFGGGFSGMVCLIPVDGSVVLSTSGNILVGITAVINRGVWMTFVRSLGKWVINSGV